MRRRIALVLFFTLLLIPCIHAEGADSSNDAPSFEKNASLRVLEKLYTGQNALVYSPISLTGALGMAADGANGNTRSQIEEFLGKIPQWELLTEDWSFTGVSIANAVFIRPSVALSNEYKETLSETYDASPFSIDSDNAAKQINDWVSESTNGMISQILSEEPGPDVSLLFVDALAMEVEWASPFPAEQTNFAVFHTPDGDVEVSSMRQTHSFAYGSVDGIYAVSLPYRNSSLQATIFMPEDGDLESLVSKLCKSPDEFLKRYIPWETAMVHLSLPIIRVESAFELKDALISMGITEAFDPELADFSVMTEELTDIHISGVLQKTALQVNEIGSKAAASTSVCLSGFVEQDIVEMNVDRPFLLLVNDPDSGYVLFAACINNPA